MRTSPEIDKIAAALVKAQSELKSVTKDAKNDFFRSKYATLDNIVEDIRPTLAKYGLAIVQGSSDPITDGTGALKTITLETMIIHSSGQFIVTAVTLPVVSATNKEKQDIGPTAQTAGSSITYGRRYGIGAALSITTDDDDDGNAANDAPARQQHKAPSITDAQVDTVTELLLADGSYEKHKAKIKTLSQAEAATWIARLTEKLKANV